MSVPTNSHDYMYPKLWEIGDNDESNMTNHPSKHMPVHITHASEESFSWARTVTRPHLKTSCSGTISNSSSTSSFLGQPKSLFKIFTSTFVIAQEFGLSTFFLAAHRCLICITDEVSLFDNDLCSACRDEARITSSVSIFCFTLPIIAIWAVIARGKQRQGKRLENKERIYYRTIDAILIAGMLRFLSSVLRSLTASYSSDTVMALAVGGMILHLLSCDYAFANGIRKIISRDGDEQSRTLSSIDITSYEDGRPLFMGGTISINSVFFSAVLLASRCQSDSTSYVFLMVTVVLFAYYPEARHVMALSFGKNIGKLFE